MTLFDRKSKSPIRLIQDAAADGAVNMARDEALMQNVGDGRVPPTLRLYEWSVPTVSLGYFQPFDDFDALPPPAGDFEVVRRPTGGGAILHDRELTYSLAFKSNDALLIGGPNRLYEWVHDALIACLSSVSLSANRCGQSDDSGPTHGPFFCFARRHCYDVMMGTSKLAGSAQRRTRAAVLQHGSIVIERRFEQQPAATLHEHGLTTEWLRINLSSAIEKTLERSLIPGSWTEAELKLADDLTQKHVSQDWLLRSSRSSRTRRIDSDAKVTET